MQIKPLTESCQESFDRKEHICFGISPFNSLFSVNYLESLISLALRDFKSFHFFLPDEPTLYTLEALGYQEEEARKKMRKQINWLKNKILKSFQSAGLEPKDHLLDWEALMLNKNFKHELDTVFQTFDSCQNFRKICMESSKWVLQNKLEENKINEKCLLKAVKYFLSEIPLFAATNKIAGVHSSIFCYHQSIEFHEQLYTGKLSYRPLSGQGFGKIIL